MVVSPEGQVQLTQVQSGSCRDATHTRQDVSSASVFVRSELRWNTDGYKVCSKKSISFINNSRKGTQSVTRLRPLCLYNVKVISVKYSHNFGFPS